MAFARPASDPIAFGVAPRHWQAIARFATQRRYVLCLRGGKRAAVRWIERGFPAKPLALKTKVHPVIGLLVADTDADRRAAWRAGYPTLVVVPDRPHEFTATLGHGPALGGARFRRGREAWAQPDLVLDPDARLPLTSDYDLAAVVDTGRFDYYGTYASWTGSANRTNPLTEAVAAELNRRFGSPRIQHGTEAQYSGSLAHGDDEVILAFHPDGDVEHFAGLPVQRTDLVLHEIILRYFPDAGHVFDQ